MQFNPQAFAMNMIKRNPAVANNPTAQEAIRAIETGDAKAGEEIANNILNSYGLTKEQAMNDISQRMNDIAAPFGLSM